MKKQVYKHQASKGVRPSAGSQSSGGWLNQKALERGGSTRPGGGVKERGHSVHGGFTKEKQPGGIVRDHKAEIKGPCKDGREVVLKGDASLSGQGSEN